MSGTVPFRSKPLALATAIAALVSMSGCSTLHQEPAMAMPITPIQRDVGAVAQSVYGDQYERGRGHFRAGKYGLALEAFEAELVQRPQSVMALNGIAAVYDKLGRYDLAVSYYYRALQIDPDSARTLSNLGYSFLLQERADAARGVLELAASLDPENSIIARNLDLAIEAMHAAPTAEAVAQQVGQSPERASVAEQQIDARPMAQALPVAAPGQHAREDEPVHRTVRKAQPVAAPSAVVSTGAAKLGKAATVPAPSQPSSVHRPLPAKSPSAVLADVAVAPSNGARSRAETVSHDTVHVPAGSYLQMAAVSAPVVEVVQPTVPETAAPVGPAVQAASVAAARPSGVSKAQALSLEAVVVVEQTTPVAEHRVSKRTGHRQLAFKTDGGTVEVSNGNGYEGMARLLSSYYAGLGQQIAHITNDSSFDHGRTVIYYQAGKRTMAESLRARLPIAAILHEADSMRTDVRVVLGRDIGFFQGVLRRAAVSEQGAAVSGGYFDLIEADTRIEVSNGNGRNGMARLLSRVLDHLGDPVSRVTNADSFGYQVTVIHYAPGQEVAARALAASLPVDAELRRVPAQVARRNVGVRVIIGRDFLRYERVMRDLLAGVVSGEAGA